MKKLQSFKTLALAFLLLAGSLSAQAISGKTVKISVDGTSPMHDWTMTSTAGTFSANVSGNSLSQVKFSTQAKNLKSTKGKMMDNKAHSALKADKAPTISFSATSVNVGKGTLSGSLSIAGVTKNVSFPVNVAKSGSSYTISGTHNMKMSDFGMQTPGFMGVKTGDGVKVSVTIVAN